MKDDHLLIKIPPPKNPPSDANVVLEPRFMRIHLAFLILAFCVMVPFIFLTIPPGGSITVSLGSDPNKLIAAHGHGYDFSRTNGDRVEWFPTAEMDTNGPMIWQKIHTQGTR